MSRAAQATKNTITLKGSTEIVTEFFGYSINSILYQRGIYPPESFARVSKYGLQMRLADVDDSGSLPGYVLGEVVGEVMDDGEDEPYIEVLFPGNTGSVRVTLDQVRRVRKASPSIEMSRLGVDVD